MRKTDFLLILLFVVISYCFIFRSFFTLDPISWGDAPFFYNDNLRELFNKPFIWDLRNNNFGADQSKVLWLFIPTFLLGLLNHLFGLNSEILIRLVFLFPATVLALFGSWLLINYFIKDRTAALLGSALYGFNTYFLILLDGGQIGVSLAYGLFPLTIFTFIRFINYKNVTNFLTTIVCFFFIFNTDLRVAIFSIILAPIFSLLKIQKIKEFKIIFISLVLVTLTVVLLSMFWVLPFLRSLNNVNDNYLQSSQLNLIELRDSLLVFQPHFPNNEFGHLSTPAFYFVLFPLFLILGLFLKREKTFLYIYLLYLICSFLAKGLSEPFGQIYNLILSLPFGVAFRDSSKFYIPLLICASFLFSFTLVAIKQRVSQRMSLIVFIAAFFYLILVIFPMFSIKGGLLNYSNKYDYGQLKQSLEKDNSFFRTIWFDERPPYAFANWDKEALSANSLYKEKPFSSMIAGTYDLYNFLHNPLLNDWFRLLGVKYVFFPENERKKSWAETEKEERGMFLSFVESVPGFSKVNLSDIPAFQIADPNRKIFSQDKTLVVLGDQSIYQLLKSKIDLNLSSQGFLFFEDGTLDPSIIFSVPKEDYIFVNNNRDLEIDLPMSFLQYTFININKPEKTNWGSYQKDNYLEAKNEFIKNNISTNDFLYGLGMIYSSIVGEESVFNLDIKMDDSYYLAIRHLSSNQGSFNVTFNGKNYELKSDKGRFTWTLLGPIDLKIGKSGLNLQNKSGFQSVNAISLVRVSDFRDVTRKISNYFGPHDLSGYFLDLSRTADLEKLKGSVSKLQPKEVVYMMEDPTKYRINKLNDGKWLIFSDHYNQNWSLIGKTKLKPFPMYSMINGFYTGNQIDPYILYNEAQDDVDEGLGISLLVAPVILIAISGYLLRKIIKKS